MSAAKYANLPDIDLEGHDVYETPDVPPSPTEVESDDEKDAARVRGTANRPGQGELDNEPLPSTETSGRFFRHAERRARRQRELYSYPDSSYSSSRSPSPSRSNLPLSQRIELMKNELANSKPKLRTRLINAMANGKNKDKAKPEADSSVRNVVPHSAQPEIAIPHGGGVVDMDQRIAQLEKLIGASGTSLDESSPLPQPLLPHLTRISNLLTLLAQPRHIDSISRRLKLLLTDLERYSASGTPSGPGAPLPPALAELAPLLQRLAPHITTIPAVLARLRTLSALHASAAGFGDAVSGLEEDQRRLRAGLADLEEAVKGLEGSISDNSGTITRNVEGLETRISSLEERLAGLSAV
ncbi:dynamitin domain-containing protein [Rhizoctonia solani]|uniref:Dynamitin domain-containing protein n=1 Tax=Rhizoctonia solani TaxID=456999 RepID=A0A8H8P267_9AGAM|nr:dynamitin domain-containing protein [Rhizoctonia solani]QRW24154.1 dynamitin domain-containing protein [Rhizoctonia solani]